MRTKTNITFRTEWLDAIETLDESLQLAVFKAVAHHIGQYVNERGFHTYTIEGFWNIPKRGIIGIYHLATAKHLPKYCKEFVYHHNTRGLSDGERFINCLRHRADGYVTEKST